ncbi:MAG: hypothetical protein HXS52_04380 [Theionarchaea archaeon]|nr:hypothetical protein [Theionarchaea archaeon]MBU7037143.1 hypothetical protein [Theionarchaea archaeon]
MPPHFNGTWQFLFLECEVPDCIEEKQYFDFCSHSRRILAGDLLIESSGAVFDTLVWGIPCLYGNLECSWTHDEF